MNDAVVAEPCATDGCAGTLSFRALGSRTLALAERMAERCGYEVTGIVLADKTRRRMGVVDGAYPKARWFPDTASFVKMMTGDPGNDISAPPAEARGDPLLCPTGARATSGQAEPPRLTDGGAPNVDPLVRLAVELGCFPVKNSDGTTTWGLPGHTTDYANPTAAIKALFALTGQGKVDGRQLSFL